MKFKQFRIPGLYCALLPVLFCHAAWAQQSDRPAVRQDRLPCDGVVSLYYGEELIWKKGPSQIHVMDGLVDMPDESQKHFKGLPLNSFLALRPDIAAIELESCQPRLRRFDRGELESDKGAALYLVATRYRGFRLRNVDRGRGGGGGMKNIGKIVMVPAATGAGAASTPSDLKKNKSGSGSGEDHGGGSGQGTGSKTGKQSGNGSVEDPDGDLTP